MSLNHNNKKEPLSENQSNGYHVAFIHPDLGIGGAEQLIVSTALGLKKQGYRVELFTAHHDINHCFDETRNGELKVTQYGDWLPRTFFGAAIAFCTILRMFWIFIRLFLSHCCLGRMKKYDIIIVDQLSAINPLYRFLCKKLVFYCHFPDLLLSPPSKSLIRTFYRYILDSLEEITTGCSDTLIVNSHFTASIVRQTFKSLRTHQLHVLHPPVDFNKVHVQQKLAENWNEMNVLFPEELHHLSSKNYVVSLNRYEKKKCVSRAIHCLVEIKRRLSTTDTTIQQHVPILVIAGGYDSRVAENVEVYEELKTLAQTLGLKEFTEIIFLKSLPDLLRWCLLVHSKAVLYTPSNEHFGIVPIESMAVGTPVIACNSGGPKESVLTNHTGYLCDDTLEEKIPIHFADALEKILKMNEEERKNIEDTCMQHVEKNFHLDAFSKKLDSILCETLTPTLRKTE